MVDGLEIVEYTLCCCEFNRGGFAHETELSIKVSYLLIIGEGMPMIRISMVSRSPA